MDMKRWNLCWIDDRKVQHFQDYNDMCDAIILAAELMKAGEAIAWCLYANRKATNVGPGKISVYGSAFAQSQNWNDFNQKSVIPSDVKFDDEQE